MDVAGRGRRPEGALEGIPRGWRRRSVKNRRDILETPGVRGSLSCVVLLGVAPQRTTDKNSSSCHEAQTSKDAHTQARTPPKARARPSVQGSPSQGGQKPHEFSAAHGNSWRREFAAQTRRPAHTPGARRPGARERTATLRHREADVRGPQGDRRPARERVREPAPVLRGGTGACNKHRCSCAGFSALSVVQVPWVAAPPAACGRGSRSIHEWQWASASASVLYQPSVSAWRGFELSQG